MPERLTARAVRSIILGRIEVMGPRPQEVMFVEAKLGGHEKARERLAEVRDWCDTCKDDPAGQRWLCPHAREHAPRIDDEQINRWIVECNSPAPAPATAEVERAAVLAAADWLEKGAPTAAKWLREDYLGGQS